MHNGGNLGDLLIPNIKVASEEIQNRMIVVEICNREAGGKSKKDVHCWIVRHINPPVSNREFSGRLNGKASKIEEW